jgi:hypothetical protein
MSSYDENPLISSLRKSYWSSDEDGQAIWETFKNDFAKKDPNSRRSDLRVVDQYLADQTSVTRDHAALMQQQRELNHIHAILWRAGR